MFDSYEILIENKIIDVLKAKGTEYDELINAMSYSASAGGKRIRPKLLMEFMRIAGGNPEDALNFAVALEMIHTYSLIHDDLPCMDNDDMRRGKPSCHKAFGESTALLAGDALLTESFGLAAKTKNVPADRVVKALAKLSECAGVNGMIGGQVIDLKYENSKAPLEVVLELYRLKTGALLKAAATIGCILAGADDIKTENACKIAEKIGLAFQIRDDILDIIGDEKVLGKPIGSDSEQNKSTYVSIVGVENAQKDVIKLTDEAISLLSAFNDTNNLKKFAESMVTRLN